MANAAAKQELVATRTESVKELLEDSLSKLQEAAAGGDKFFPEGINNIEFVVAVANVELTVRVSGK